MGATGLRFSQHLCWWRLAQRGVLEAGWDDSGDDERWVSEYVREHGVIGGDTIGAYSDAWPQWQRERWLRSGAGKRRGKEAIADREWARARRQQEAADAATLHEAQLRSDAAQMPLLPSGRVRAVTARDYGIVATMQMTMMMLQAAQVEAWLAMMELDPLPSKVLPNFPEGAIIAVTEGREGTIFHGCV